jgi:hypothetical protein
MKKNEDPSLMFEQICGIDNRFQRAAIALTEEEKIATITMAAPKEYVTLLTAEQRIKGGNLKLDDFQEAMLAQWRQMHNSVEQTKGTEIRLTEFATIVNRQDIEQTTVHKNEPMEEKSMEDADEEADAAKAVDAVDKEEEKHAETVAKLAILKLLAGNSKQMHI